MTKCEKVIEKAKAIEQAIEGINCYAYGLNWNEETERFEIPAEYAHENDEVRQYRCDVYNQIVTAVMKLL